MSRARSYRFFRPAGWYALPGSPRSGSVRATWCGFRGRTALAWRCPYGYLLHRAISPGTTVWAEPVADEMYHFGVAGTTYVATGGSLPGEAYDVPADTGAAEASPAIPTQQANPDPIYE